MPSQEELKAARKRLNLTTKQCAEMLNKSQNTWQRWEGQTASKKTIPPELWELFKIKTCFK